MVLSYKDRVKMKCNAIKLCNKRKEENKQIIEI